LAKALNDTIIHKQLTRINAKRIAAKKLQFIGKVKKHRVVSFSRQAGFDALPDDLVAYIFKFLDLSSALDIVLTSTRFRVIERATIDFRFITIIGPCKKTSNQFLFTSRAISLIWHQVRSLQFVGIPVEFPREFFQQLCNCRFLETLSFTSCSSFSCSALLLELENLLTHTALQEIYLRTSVQICSNGGSLSRLLKFCQENSIRKVALDIGWCQVCNEPGRYCDSCGCCFCCSCELVALCESCKRAFCDQCRVVTLCELCQIQACNVCVPMEVCVACEVLCCEECHQVRYCEECDQFHCDRDVSLDS
jgi:hypothetical protein